MKKPLLFLIITLVAVSFIACKKYEEGPLVSLLTKKQRLDGEWGLVLVKNKGVDVTEFYPDDHAYIFDKNGSFKKISNAVEVTGTWEFNSDKSEIILTVDNSAKSDAWVIIRLTNKHLWLERTLTTPDGPDVTEEHYEAK